MNEGNAGELKLHFLDYWRVIRVRFPLVILIFLLVLITAAVVTYFMPKQYASTVTLQVKQNSALQIFSQGNGNGFDPRFATTQFQIIQRKEILYPVIDSLGLMERWGTKSKEQAYFRLRNALDVREIRNTDLLQLIVYSNSNVEAAELANTIAKEYQRKRISEQEEWIAKSLGNLDDQVLKQRREVDRLRADAARIRIEQGIYDLNPDTVMDPAQAQNNLLMSVEQQVSETSLKVGGLRTKYEQIAGMTDDQIMRSIASLEISDPTISQVLPEYQSLSAEQARMLNSGLGPNHPNVKSLRAKLEVLRGQLQDQITSLRKTLESNLKIAEEQLKTQQEALEKARSNQQNAKTKASTYFEAKNAYIQAKGILDSAEMRLRTQGMERTMPQNPATIWELAEPAEAPSRPNWTLNIGLGAVVGIVFGIGLAFFIEYLDTSVKTMEDVESLLGVPVLAVVPKDTGLLMNESPECPDAEGYRILRTNIEFNRKSPEANAITVVSGGAGEGKSTTIANLAYTFARGGYKTLVVDADLRRPTQHRIFEIRNEIGLSNYLTTDIDLEEVVNYTKVENLYLLPSGGTTEDIAGILNSQRMMDMVEEIKKRFDIVLLDSPPILGVSDASVLASLVDLTIVVVQHRRFPRAMLQRVKQGVLNVGGTILGVVLNNVDIKHDQHYQYYTSYYHYYANPADKKSRKKGAKAGIPKEQPEKIAPTVMKDDGRIDY